MRQIAENRSAGYVRNALRVLLALSVMVVASLAITSPAFAVYDHTELQAKFPSGCAEGPNPSIEDIAVDEDNNWIYVYCEIGEPPYGKIYRLNYSGGPAAFSAVKPYISSNQLIGNPGAGNGTFIAGFAGGHIAIDNSGGPKDGLIYIIAAGSGVSGGSENIQIFAPSGEYLGPIAVPASGFGAGSKDVDVGPDGSVYYLAEQWISKYNASYNEVARMYTSGAEVFSQGNRIAVDGHGAVWNVVNGPKKFEPDQLFTNYPPSFGVEQERFTGMPSPFAPYPLLSGEFNNGVHIAVDPGGRNDLYVNRGNKIEAFTEGNASDPSHAAAPAFGNGSSVAGPGISVTKSHLVFSSASGVEISRFGPGQILPDVRTDQVDVDHVGHQSAELSGDVSLDGGTPVNNCELQIGTSTAYSSPPVPCTPSSFGSDSTVEAEPTGLTTGTTYHYRFKATNEKGTNFGADRTFTPAYVLKVKTLTPSPVAEHEVTLRGSLDPDGKETEYFFEYGVDANYGQETEAQSAGSAPGVTTRTAVIQGLPSGREFHYRIVTSNLDGTTVGKDQIFRTASAPDIVGIRATDLTETAATLRATINPVGFPTTYRFEYGTSTDYGTSVPFPDESLGSGTEPVDVEQRITGLTPGTTYHFRVVATNDPWGTAVSTDTTFDFAPPACPNDHVRQETASSYLPDCRAYELVSPGSAGAVQLFPSQEAWDLYKESQDPLSENGMWALNNGLGIGPAAIHVLRPARDDQRPRRSQPPDNR